MSAERFLDSNVLIYQLDTRDRRKHAIADAIVAEGMASQNACISYQVVQECLHVALRKAEVRLDAAQAAQWLDVVLAPLMTVASSAALYRRAIELQHRTRFGFYDSLVVAGALEAGCTTLLTEDLQHGQQIDSLHIVDPFRRA
jgi:predicted nucleic acid-binding protein